MHVEDHSDELLEKEKKAQRDFENAINIEETFRKESAKVKWYIEGEMNTAYLAKINHCTNLITLMRDGNNFVSDNTYLAMIILIKLIGA